MGRIANLTEKPLAGAEIIVNGAGDEAGYVPADEFATAAQGALADTAVQPADISNVDNTSDADKPISTATQTALDLKAPIASPTFTGTVAGITKSMVGLGNVDNTADTAKPVSTAQQTALDLKADLASPTFTGTVGGITKSMVGLGSVDNTSDAGKPVSTAQQTALDLKANIASPTFTGTVGGITKSMVGLGNVDNTADNAKPAFTGDSGSGGAKGLVPAPAAGDAAANKFLSADGSWTAPAGSGDVVGPASSTAGNLAAFDDTTGKLLEDSGIPVANVLVDADIGSTVFTQRTITGTANEIDVANGNGASANPTLSLPTVAKPYGKQAIPIPAGAMKSRTTNGAAAGSAEMTTNKNMFVTLDFDASTQEFAQFSIPMPKSWNESTVTFVPVWSHASTTTNFGVVWSLAGVALSNDDAGDVAFGTVQTSTDTGGTTNDIYFGPESSAITIAGTPAENDLVMFQVARVPADGSDTMAIDARLHGITLYITTNAGNDA